MKVVGLEFATLPSIVAFCTTLGFTWGTRVIAANDDERQSSGRGIIVRATEPLNRAEAEPNNGEDFTRPPA